MYKPHTNCRGCGYGPSIVPSGVKIAPTTEKLVPILNLGIMPLPNAFRKEGEWIPGHYPVELLACPVCGLGQLSAVVDPDVLYSDYAYVTSTSRTMDVHFTSLWELLCDVCGKNPKSIIEIGSNDGLFLERMKEHGVKKVYGIDPARNLVTLCRERGVDAMCSKFTRQAAELVSAEVYQPDVIVARHVFCHIDDWRGFMDSAAVLCGKDTALVIEVPYAGDTIEKTEWDQIYAEHLSYLTIKSVKKLIKDSAFRLVQVVRYPIHGGAIALIFRRVDSPVWEHDSVKEFMEHEDCSIDAWKAFANRATDQINNLKILVDKLGNEGKRVAGLGASAKSTVWINACGFNRNDIYAVYDCTPQKWYTQVPGTRIPVLHEGGFYVDAPDYAIIWAWNFLDEILEKNKKWVESGGKFIVPVPEVRVL